MPCACCSGVYCCSSGAADVASFCTRDECPPGFARTGPFESLPQCQTYCVPGPPPPYYCCWDDGTFSASTCYPYPCPEGLERSGPHQDGCADHCHAGACCEGGDCTETTRVECDSLGGEFQGEGTLCSEVECSPPPECESDADCETGHCCEGTCQDVQMYCHYTAEIVWTGEGDGSCPGGFDPNGETEYGNEKCIKCETIASDECDEQTWWTSVDPGGDWSLVGNSLGYTRNCDEAHCDSLMLDPPP